MRQLDLTQALIDSKVLLLRSGKLSPIEERAVRTLIEAVEWLSIRAGIDSGNSSIPPSKDPNRLRKSRSCPGIKRKPGAQEGHVGTTLKRVDNPDEIEKLLINRNLVPSGYYKTVGFETRQVFDIQMSVLVKEYQAEVIENQEGEQWVAQFPEGVTQAAQYGSYTKAASVYLSMFQLIPLDRVREYFKDQADLFLSKGSIANFNVEAAEKLEVFEVWAKEKLRHAPHVHADETGVNIGGKRAWLHNLSNDTVTLFHCDEKRGTKAMERMGVLPDFKGNLIHDHWKAYFRYGCQHTLCNAHHLRELEWCVEFEQQLWAGKMKILLLEINTERVREGCIATLARVNFELRYRTILREGEVECPVTEKTTVKQGRTKKSKSRNLLERLQNFEAETLRFMRDPAVPFTNNQGERDLRMTKVQQKISGCFRSMAGAKNFCRIRGYLATCKKNDVSPTLGLQLLFDGKLPDFMR